MFSYLCLLTHQHDYRSAYQHKATSVLWVSNINITSVTVLIASDGFQQTAIRRAAEIWLSRWKAVGCDVMRRTNAHLELLSQHRLMS
jgi:hypothetical protein